MNEIVKTFPILRFGSRNVIFPSEAQRATPGFGWVVQRAIADARFAALKQLIAQGFHPLPERSTVTLEVRILADAISSEAVEMLGHAPHFPSGDYTMRIAQWDGVSLD